MNYENNTTVAVTPLQVLSPDLIVESVLVTPDSAQLGQSVTVIWRVKNSGTAPATAVNGWIDHLFIATGPNDAGVSLPLADEAVAGSLAPGESYTRTRAITLPLLPKLPEAPFAIRVQIDNGNSVPESNEGNNLAATVVALTLPPLPDLVITQITAPAAARPGETISLTWTASNRGNAPSTGGWTENVYLAPFNVLAGRAPLATFRFTESLATGASVSRTRQVELPLDLPAGDAPLAVLIDAGDEIVESDEVNNAAAPAPLPKIPALLQLQLPVTTIAEAATDPKLSALLTRNGDTTTALTVTLASSDVKELTAPATVSFRVGESSVAFALNVQRDGVPDGDKPVAITASAAGHEPASIVVTVQNSDTPRLKLQLASPVLLEGEAVMVTLSHDAINKPALTVRLGSTGNGQLLLTESVSIPAGQSSVTVTVAAGDDTRIDPKRTCTIDASAPGFTAASAIVDVLDNDLPSFSLVLGAATVSEGAGVEAATATVSRGTASPRSLVVALENSNSGAARVPASVTIPGGQTSVSVPIGVVNNSVVDGAKTTVIRAFALATTSGERVVQSDPVTLTITDDDGPTLTLTLARDLAAEGLATATTLTVSRNAATTQPLAVTLTSSVITEATVPASVTIPAGMASASVPVTSIDDQLSDGSKRVEITGSAPGFASGAASLVVTDVNLPDLVVSEVTTPDTAETEAYINTGYRVTNQGLAPGGLNWTTRVFLSADPVVGDDTTLAEYAFTGTLPPGQSFGQSRQVRLPQAPGDYWIIVATDIASEIGEILEDNNTTIAVRPIRVVAAYSATVETDLDNAPAGTAVALRGTAVKTSTGGPAPFALVNIHLHLRGTRRIISALADELGRFNTTFTPLPGEAGFYEIGAAHPGSATALIQDSFTLHGMKAAPVEALKMAENSATTRGVEIQNLGDRPLTRITIAVVEQPANITVDATLAAGADIPALGLGQLNLAITARDASAAAGQVLLRLTSAEGARLEIPLSIAVESLRPRLVVNPAELFAGMKTGGQAFVSFEVTNQGGAASEPVGIALPDNMPWMRVVTANPLPPLAPGDKSRVTLQLRPAADLPLGNYDGNLWLGTSNNGVSVPFRFRALSEAKGDLRVTVVDEYTFYAEGAPKVAGATVTVRDAVSEAVVATGVTDAAGQYSASQLPEGYYEVLVSAVKHTPFRGTTLVVAGKVNEFEAFPRREAVRYIWKVVPTEIQDRTRIVIETIFEAFVPMPVITVDPPLIDLADYTADVTQVDLKITNHGLIAAKEVGIFFGTHPDWSLEPLVTELGDIPARSSFTVPVLIKRLNNASPQSRVARASLHRFQGIGLHGGGGCSISGSCKFIVECGGGKQGGGAPVIIVNASGNCGGSGGGYPGGSGGGGGRGGGGSGGSPADSSASIRSCDDCALATMRAIAECALKFILSDGLKCAKDSYGCVSGMKSGITLGGGYKCAKAVIACAKAAGKKIPLVGGLKYIECAYGILKACDSLGGGGSGGGGGGAGGGGDNARPNFTEHQSGAGVALHAAGVYRAMQSAVSATPDLSQLSGRLRPFTVRLERMAAFFQPMIHVFGDEAWLPDEDSAAFDKWTDAFLLAVEESSPGGPVINTTERASLLALPRPVTVSAGLAGRTVDRWNRSIEYWNSGIYFSTQVPDGQSRDFIALDEWFQMTDLALQGIAQSESEGYTDPVDAVQQFGGEYQKFLSEGDGGGVCAHVRLRLEQEAIVTREAFKASLEIVNDSATPLTDVFVDVSVRRRNGQDSTAFFAIKPPELSGVAAVDGTGVVTAGTTGQATWTLIPTTDAVLESPEEFLVGGLLRYRQDALIITISLAPSVITVHPSPSLAVKYFHERQVFADDPFTPQVEPSIPYSLAVMVQNKGHGTARNVRIASAQPKIVENKKGLLADFKIIATEVARKNLEPSLTVEFGEISPRANAIGRWLFTSTIQGGFVDYSASFEHLDGLGSKKLSLIEGVKIHELIHIVRATGNLEDGRPDFLANDVPDLYDRPDTLHMSDGSLQPVSVVLEGVVDRPPTTANLQVQLSAKMPAGFAYLRVPDPGQGRFRLASVVRSDGVEVPFGDNAWTTDRTFLGNSRRPLVEHTVHLFDRDSTGRYTLYYALPPTLDETPPTSAVAALPGDSSARIVVNWSGQDNAGGSGVQFYDVFLSTDGGPFIQWQHETFDRTAVYQGALGRNYAFYSIATDNAGNREAAPATPDARTKVTRINRAPTLDPIPDQAIKEGGTFSLQLVATDPDGDELVFSLNSDLPPNVVIHPYTGLITWVTGAGSGSKEYEFVPQVLDNGAPRLGAIQKFKVVIGSVNFPPTIEPIPNQTVNEGRLLSVTALATDASLPKQKLSFSLAPGAPVGASIDAESGVFTWRPSDSQGGVNYRITVLVRDDGTPALEDRRTFSVNVRDTRSDFIAGFNSGYLVAGQSGALALNLTSGGDLRMLVFELAAADLHLSNLALMPLGDEIASLVFTPAGDGKYQVKVEFDSNRIQSGSRVIARLGFDTSAAGSSSVVRLTLGGLAGERFSGESLTRPSAFDGRLYIIEREPLLDIETGDGGIKLALFGRIGSSAILQSTQDPVNGPWIDQEATFFGDSVRVIDLTVNPSSPTFFRLIER